MSPAVHLLAKDHSSRTARAAIRALQASGATVQPIAARTGADVGGAVTETLSEISRLVVAGGDGLIHLAVQVLAETDIPVGIMPIGTGNDIARALGLSRRPFMGMAEAAQRALADPTPIDLLKVGGSWVVSVLTAGFSGNVNEAANHMRFPKGQAKYTIATIGLLRRLQAVPMALTSEGFSLNENMALVAVGNTKYFGGGMAICPLAHPNDGQAHVVSVADVSALTFARVLPRAFTGSHVKHEAVRDFVTARVRIQTDEVLWADGERLQEDASEGLVIETVPKALLVAGYQP